MIKLKDVKDVIVGNKPLKDVWHYFVGNYRYKLYYSKDGRGTVRAYGSRHPLMRKHIWEQIKFRIRFMKKDCFNNGSCILCGCMTTHLQMSNKSCNFPCYPAMMNRKEWENYKIGKVFKDSNGSWIALLMQNNKPLLIPKNKSIEHVYISN